MAAGGKGGSSGSSNAPAATASTAAAAAAAAPAAAAAAASPRRRKEYKTLGGETTYEEVIKKSRFVTRAAPCATYPEAQLFLRRVSDPKATHNCWAFRGQAGEERSSDDGEPGGTAGRPMLAAVEGEGLADVMVVVTRCVLSVCVWFLVLVLCVCVFPLGGGELGYWGIGVWGVCGGGEDDAPSLPAKLIHPTHINQPPQQSIHRGL
jgi:hypothetical protein